MATRRQASGAESGFTLVEVMVSAFLVLIVFFGAAQYASKTRLLLNHDEHRRQAIAVAQARLEEIRTSLTFDTLATLANADTTYMVGGCNFNVQHIVRVDTPQTGAATVTVNLTWNVVANGTAIPRSLSMTTILSRSFDTIGGAGPLSLTLAGAGGGGGGGGGDEGDHGGDDDYGGDDGDDS